MGSTFKAVMMCAAALACSAFPAAAGRWTCDGPAYVCGHDGGSATSAKSKGGKLAAAKRKSARNYDSYAYAGSGGQTGLASWYGGRFHGRRTASGETYNQWALTAAHKTLPFGTRVQVTNTRSGNSVVVRINDRGPFVRGRVIDLSKAAANQLGVGGVAPVRLTVLGRG